MIGIGAQEILLLAFCCGFPLGAGAIVLIVVMHRQRNRQLPHRPDNMDS